MPRLIENSLDRHAVCIRISRAAHDALREVAKTKGGTVTSRAQELVEACKQCRPQHWHRALASFEERGRGE